MYQGLQRRGNCTGIIPYPRLAILVHDYPFHIRKSPLDAFPESSNQTSLNLIILSKPWPYIVIGIGMILNLHILYVFEESWFVAVVADMGFG